MDDAYADVIEETATYMRLLHHEIFEETINIISWYDRKKTQKFEVSPHSPNWSLIFIFPDIAITPIIRTPASSICQYMQQSFLKDYNEQLL